MKRLLLAAMTLLLVAASPETETEHTVAPGETLHGIANRAKVSREAIIAANGLREPYVVRTGQVLQIPRTQRHRVAAGDTPFLLAWRYGVTWQDIAVANNLDADAKLRRGQQLLIPSVIVPPRERSTVRVPPPIRPASRPSTAETGRFAWPLSGTIRRGYSSAGRTEHPGLDIVAKAGTAVRAVADGRVIFAGEEPQQYGTMVIVDHGGGWHSAYAFLNRVTVKEGERVKATERVGLVGHTGQATRDELHFELRRDNRPVDPLPLLPER
ncbi:MAG: peptidoglycan DD-metalloendopeptidase family protein [Novosphingobium sp.]